jgi:hypothetical protein
MSMSANSAGRMVWLTPQGNWGAEIERTLKNALAVSMEIVGRTGEEACRHAIILMAQSARALAKTAKPKRKILRDDAAGGSGKGDKLKGARYMEVWHQGATEPAKLYEYRWKFGFGNKPKLTGSFEQGLNIKNRGLAKRSWMWGLGKLGASGVVGSPIPGTSVVRTITSEKVNGYIKENKLSYITKAMPAGWEMAGGHQQDHEAGRAQDTE